MNTGILLTIFKNWKIFIFGAVLVGSAILINNWHYRPIKKMNDDLKECIYKIELYKRDLQQCKNDYNAKEAELHLCEESVDIYYDDNETPITNTLKDGYVIF
jgi:hypothetical protein